MYVHVYLQILQIVGHQHNHYLTTEQLVVRILIELTTIVAPQQIWAKPVISEI